MEREEYETKLRKVVWCGVIHPECKVITGELLAEFDRLKGIDSKYEMLVRSADGCQIVRISQLTKENERLDELAKSLEPKWEMAQWWLDKICEPWLDEYNKHLSDYGEVQDLIRWWYRQAATNSIEGRVMRAIADYLDSQEPSEKASVHCYTDRCWVEGEWIDKSDCSTCNPGPDLFETIFIAVDHIVQDALIEKYFLRRKS